MAKTKKASETKDQYKELYAQFKHGARKYQEEIHCPMVLSVMNTEGTMTAFCRKAQISDALFYDWVKRNPLFAECYAYGKILSRSNWEAEGENGKDEEYFNFDYWRITGAQRYGIGKNRVRMGINPDSSPYEQYKELIDVANSSEFNASEIKQLMESINVGIRAYENFKMQEEMNKIKEDLARMGAYNGNDTVAIENDTKTD